MPYQNPYIFNVLPPCWEAAIASRSAIAQQKWEVSNPMTPVDFAFKCQMVSLPFKWSFGQAHNAWPFRLDSKWGGPCFPSHQCHSCPQFCRSAPASQYRSNVKEEWWEWAVEKHRWGGSMWTGPANDFICEVDYSSGHRSITYIIILVNNSPKNANTSVTINLLQWYPSVMLFPSLSMGY